MRSQSQVKVGLGLSTLFKLKTKKGFFSLIHTDRWGTSDNSLKTWNETHLFNLPSWNFSKHHRLDFQPMCGDESKWFESFVTIQILCSCKYFQNITRIRIMKTITFHSFHKYYAKA